MTNFETMSNLKHSPDVDRVQITGSVNNLGTDGNKDKMILIGIE